MKKTTKKLRLKITVVRNLSDDDLQDVVGGERPTYERNCSMGLCPGSDWATCRSIMATACTMCA